VKPDSVGVVTKVYSKGGRERCVVTFSEQSDWEGIQSEMEILDDSGSAGDAGAMAVGARVKVKSGVKPSTGWGAVRALERRIDHVCGGASCRAS
jgi:hypothetical protein